MPVLQRLMKHDCKQYLILDIFAWLSLQTAVARGMEKGRVYLTPRDSVGKKNVDWDGLVNDVFKQEVDQFYIECGVQSLYIQQQPQGLDSNQQSSSNAKESSSSSVSSSISLKPLSTSPWTDSNSCNSRWRQDRWQKHKSPLPTKSFNIIPKKKEGYTHNSGKLKVVQNQRGIPLKNKLLLPWPTVWLITRRKLHN